MAIDRGQDQYHPKSSLFRILKYGTRGPTSSDFAGGRGLDKKSYLKFHFPNGLVARLPFYENVQIKEDKKAKMVTYNPVGRSSSLYAYTGAESRRIKLDFALTLPHLQEVYNGNKWRFESRTLFTDEDKRELFRSPKSDSLKKDMRDKFGDAPAHWVDTPDGPTVVPELYADDLAVASHLDDLDRAALGANLSPGNLAIKDRDFLFERAKNNFNIESSLNLTKMVNFVSWWVNLIRSSVLNNQEDMTQGPPVVRLVHGPLYRDIPCVCKGYSITYDDRAGMDLQTLLSRRILVSLNLEEFRAGDFGTYRAGQLVKRDNVAGWESVIRDGTTDPGGLML